MRVTNLGLGFVLMTLVVAIGATNTGNNGLYILVSLFLAALVVSGVVSRRNVEHVTRRAGRPDGDLRRERRRGSPSVLTNRGRLSPARHSS